MSENQPERDLGPGAVGDAENPGSPSTPVEETPQPEQQSDDNEEGE